jgi:hypothetical protein
MKRVIIGALFATWCSAVAFAQDVGIPVTIEVKDAVGTPIATAVVRHPDEADRHRVNVETGRYTTGVLYLPNGDELIFDKGMELEFEVSAPGYENARVKYIVQKRKNIVPVILTKMDFSLEDDEDLDDPVIQFGRDKPLDK